MSISKTKLLGLALGLFSAAGMNGAAYAVGHAQPYVTDAATQLLYHLDEKAGSANAVDRSRHNRTATYGSGVLAGQAGPDFLSRSMQPYASNTGRTFWKDTGNGASSVLLTAAAGNFTIEGWFRLDSTTRLNSHPAVLFGVQPDGSTNADYMLYIKRNDANDDRALGMVFRDRQRFLAWSETLEWKTTAWYHIAIVAQVNGINTTYTLYRTTLDDRDPEEPCPGAGCPEPEMDVVAQMTLQNLTPDTSTVDRVFSVGNLYGNNGSDSFPGRIDEVRFSSVARTTDDFTAMLSWTTWAQIRAEALASNLDAQHPEHALPLIGSWNGGNKPYVTYAPSVAKQYDFTPAWQATQIGEGHHLLPWFNTPHPEALPPDPARSYGGYDFYSSADNYYEDGLLAMQAMDLPISFVGAWNRGDGACGQWECYLNRPVFTRADYSPLTPDPDYLSYTGDASPNFIRSDGTPVVSGSGASAFSVLSAFGDTAPWQQVGTKWASSPLMSAAQTYYPEPPKILFVSNNEQKKESWSNQGSSYCGVGGSSPCKVADDQHYIDKNLTAQNIIKVVGNGWDERYGYMQSSWRAALTSAWSGVSGFVGYGAALGPSNYRRTSNWHDYSLAYDNGGSDYRIDRTAEIWNGGSAELYSFVTNPGSGVLGDNMVMSVQVEAMNLVFMRDEAYRVNPDFWFELSIWNGCDNIDEYGLPIASSITWQAECLNFTSAHTAERYAGWVRFAMWMLQPRLVRDFRGYNTVSGPSTSSAVALYFEKVQRAVDEVYESEILQRFWRDSTLVVADPSKMVSTYNYYKHPYQAGAGGQMARFDGVDRMFMLPVAENTDFNAALSALHSPPHTAVPYTTQIKVFAVARVRGEAGHREWLVYVHSPEGVDDPVHITIPDYAHNNGVIVVDAPVGGAFYIIHEDTHDVCGISTCSSI